jgi:hypothetical protein
MEHIGMRDFVARWKAKRSLMGGAPLDFEGGLIAGLFCAVYAAAVGGVRGVHAGLMSGQALGLLVLLFGAAGAVVGAVVLGRPDFGPSKRTAAVRGIVAAVPVYATGGLLFLPVERWFSLLPLLSVTAAGLVGPPIGIFVYRLHRRRDAAEAPVDPGVELAWLKGEMLGSWTPLLVSIAILATLGVGMRALPAEVAVPPPRPLTPPSLAEVVAALPGMREAVLTDSLEPNARFRLGAALLSVGQFENSVEHLRKAVDLDSSSVASWIALGRASYFADSSALSTRAYWNVIRLDPAALSPTGLDRVILDAALSTQLQDGAVEP